jgi:hypothetical protein
VAERGALAALQAVRTSVSVKTLQEQTIMESGGGIGFLVVDR